MASRLQHGNAAMFRKLLTIGGFFCLVALPLCASARLTYTIGDKAVPVAWPASSFPVTYQTDARVINTLPNAAVVIERAFSAWATVPDTNISFRSLGVANGLTAGNDGRNTITLADDLFKDQYAIAMTTDWYDTSGRVTEADIQIDATLVNSDYNVQQAVTHEVGHLLGLDHSAVLSSIMYPWV